MYLCPRCNKQYDDVPEACVQCKRPLILNKRYRIEMPVQSGITGEDFDVLDLKRDEPVILRELRVRKADQGKRKAEIDRYNANRTRLGAMKYEGNKVLVDAFKQEFKNSVCYYFVFDADAWASLGDELDGAPGGGGGGGAAEEEELPSVEGRDLDPEMAAMLAKLEARSGGGDDGKKAKKAKKVEPSSSDDDGAMVKAESSSALKKSGGGGGIATKAKVVVGVSLLVIILVAVLVLVVL